MQLLAGSENASLSVGANDDEIDEGHMDSGYLETEECMSESDVETSEGTYLETADDNTGCEESWINGCKQNS